MNLMNYWNLDLDELPTRGVFYDENAIIRIRPLAVSEVKQLATLCDMNSVSLVNELLRRCLELENLEFNEITLADREYLVFWIRANTYVQSAGYTITAQCPQCKQEFEKQFRVEQFDTKYIQRRLDTIHLPDCNIDIPMKMPTIKELKLFKISTTPDEITNIAMHINATNDLQTRIEFIKALSAKDYAVLKYSFEDFKCGIDKTLPCECPKCHSRYNVLIGLADNKLFAPTKTREILEEITHIAKYTHVQITDDWLWREVEIERDIVNEMIKKENEEHQKEMAKANAKQSAAMAKARAHGFHG